VVEQWFDRLDYRQVLPLGAVDVNNHRLVAVSLLLRGPQAAGHNGEIRLFVPEPYRELGLAGLLLDEVLHLAARGDLLWLSAEVIRDCRPLVQAFQARGFEVKATFEQYLRRANGATRDVVLLMRPVKP
jgi:GNAT superfamily N-acetyltransferase